MTATLDAPVDTAIPQPGDIARRWLAGFGAALERGDVRGAAQHFLVDGWWRDLLSFTWDLQQAEQLPSGTILMGDPAVGTVVSASVVWHIVGWVSSADQEADLEPRGRRVVTECGRRGLCVEDGHRGRFRPERQTHRTPEIAS